MRSSTPLQVLPHTNDFGARITGVNLSQPQRESLIAEIRALWLRYQVVYFPDQPLDHVQLEQFTHQFGPFGEDPYVEPLDGHPHILEVRREPDEKIMPFGASWHSDWSFQAKPPSATILHAKIVPPTGGDTHYADSIRALESMDPVLRNEITGLNAVHSARRPYSHQGFKRSGGDQRSMTIVPSGDAWDTTEHPLVRTHPESGRQALWINPVYTIGITGMPQTEADKLLQRLFAHLLKPEFIYRHSWAPNMLTMWDNRSVLHCANGGYDGHRRVMHRTVVAGETPC